MVTEKRPNNGPAVRRDGPFTTSRKLRFVLGLIVCLALVSVKLFAADIEANGVDDDADQLPHGNMSVFIEALARQSLKKEYIDERHWNRQEKVFDGWGWKHGKIRTRRQEVNHGLWQRYKLKPIDPEHRFVIQIRSLPLDATKPAMPKASALRFELFVSTRLSLEADYALWTWGVKGVNGKVEADATVEARAICSLETRTTFEPGSLMPHFTFLPQVHEIHLRLEDIDLERVFLLSGPISKELGKGMRHTLEDILQEQEPKILKKIQKSLDKQNQKRLNPAA